MEVNILENERIDNLNRKGYKIIQNLNKFCFGIDSVLLAAFVNMKKNSKVIDFGTGTGILPILIEARNGGENYIGIDIQKESVDMAIRSVKLNNLEDKIQIKNIDIKNVNEYYKSNSFDVVVSNPPYIEGNSGLKNENECLKIARHEVLINLETIVKQASYLLSFGGSFYMVHKPHRLPEIFEYFAKYHIEPKTLRFVYPYINKEPNMVLIQGVKQGKRFLKVLPPLVVYEEPGKYTKEVLDLYNN